MTQWDWTSPVRLRERTSDPLLRPLFRAETEEERQAVVERLLLEHAYPRIDRALDSRYRQSSVSPSHREDLRAEVILRLVNRLHALAHDDRAEPLERFDDYVAVVAFNAFDNLLRRCYPLRSRLKNRIRYALRHDRRLAEWQSGSDRVGGLAAWKERSDALQALDPPMLAQSDVREQLVTLFEHVQRPVAVNALVAAVAEVHGMGSEDLPQRLAAVEKATHPRPDEVMANAAHLKAVWTEIETLPPRQRIALLLNARDAAGESVLRLLTVTGVASARQIGATLDIEAGQLAELWHELPLEDARIAGMLQVTRQQVINLRQAARHRLARRLRDKPGRGGRRS